MSSVSSFVAGSTLGLSGLLDQPAASESQPFAVLHAVAAEKTSGATLTPASAALAEINHILKTASIGVQFEFDKEAHTIIAKVVNVETGQLLRQMSSEEVGQISKVLGKLQDLLVHQAICRKAQLTAGTKAPAPARWSRPWLTAAAPAQAPSALKPVSV
jgi:flagellar protein FlaG